MALAAVLSLAGCGHNARYYFDRAAKLTAQGKPEEATLDLQKAIQRDANYGEAWFQLGLLLAQQRKGTEAYQALTRAVELLPGREDVKVKTANVVLTAYLGNGGRSKVLYDKLNDLAAQLLAANKASYDGWRIKGFLAASDKKPEIAEADFRNANAAKPMQPEVIVGWTVALLEENKAEDARKLAFQLIEQDKTYAPIYDALHRYYADAGRLDDAEKILRLRAENNPSDAAAAIDLAASYAARSKETEMRRVLERMLDDEKDFPDGRLQVGDFYGRLQRWSEALEQYQAEAAAHPKQRLVCLEKISDAWLAQGNSAEVAKVTAEILKEYPDNDSARAVNASLLINGGKPADIARAAATLQSLVQKIPDNPIWRYSLGRALMAKGDASGARRQFETVAEMRPELLEPRVALVELSQSAGDHKAALHYAEDALAHAPNHPRFRLLRAVSLMYTGKDAEAAAELGALERSFPRDRDVQLELAALDLHQRNFRQAEARFRRLADTDGSDIRAASGLAEALAAENQADKALALLAEDVRKSPDAAGFHSLLAKTASQAGKMDLAIEQYRWLQAKAPDSAQANMDLGNAYELSGDPASAVAYFRKATALDPGDASAEGRLGDALSLVGKNDEALASFRRALQLKPGNPDFLNASAYLIAETHGSLDEALKLAQMATRVDSKQPDYLDTLGWIYFRKKMNPAALQIFRELTNEYPEKATFRYHLAMALLQAGDRAAARVQLRTALSRKPADQVRQDIETALAGIG